MCYIVSYRDNILKIIAVYISFISGRTTQTNHNTHQKDIYLFLFDTHIYIYYGERLMCNALNHSDCCLSFLLYISFFFGILLFVLTLLPYMLCPFYGRRRTNRMTIMTSTTTANDPQTKGLVRQRTADVGRQ